MRAPSQKLAVGPRPPTRRSVQRPDFLLHQAAVLAIAADLLHCAVRAADGRGRPVRFSRGLRALLLISHSDWLAYALRQLRRSLVEIVDQLAAGFGVEESPGFPGF